MRNFLLYASLIGLLSIGAAGCTYDSEGIQNSAWAVVDIEKIKKEVRKKITEENPFPGSLLKRIQSTDKDALNTKNEIDAMMREAVAKCARKQAEESDEGGSKPTMELVTGYQRIIPKSGHKRVNSENYNMKCVRSARREAKSDSSIVELRAGLKRLHDKAAELSIEKTAYHAMIRKKIELEMKSVINKYAEGRFDLVLSTHSEVFYNKQNFSVDVTDAIVKSIREVNTEK